MLNWREYVGLYQATSNSKGVCKVPYLYVKRGENFTEMSISLSTQDTYLSAYVLSDDDVGKAVEEIFLDFPDFKISGEESIRPFEINKARHKIAHQTRRGSGKHQFGNTVYYKGNFYGDNPIIVAEYNLKFFILKHPKFEQYGFNIKETK